MIATIFSGQVLQSKTGEFGQGYRFSDGALVREIWSRGSRFGTASGGGRQKYTCDRFVFAGGAMRCGRLNWVKAKAFTDTKA